MRKPVVYIAGPYSNPDGEQLANVHRMMDAADDIIDMGAVAVWPLASHFLHERRPREWMEWMAQDLELVGRCDFLYRMPGESHGADLEVREAERKGIWVFRDLDDLHVLLTIWLEMLDLAEELDDGIRK